MAVGNTKANKSNTAAIFFPRGFFRYIFPLKTFAKLINNFVFELRSEFNR
jgi:hypothetical protein